MAENLWAHHVIWKLSYGVVLFRLVHAQVVDIVGQHEIINDEVTLVGDILCYPIRHNLRLWMFRHVFDVTLNASLIKII